MIRVLSIDDSKVIHKFLATILEGKVQLSFANDGLEGVEKVASGEQFDLILLDWEMPKLTGVETLKRLRTSGVTTPIIMLTSKNTPEDITEALGLGANEYIMKPFVSDIVIEKIESVLGRSLT